MDEVKPQVGSDDVDKNKAMAIIGYLIPILFFIPLVTDAKNSPFAKFHANQQLSLLLAYFVVNFIGMVIPIIGWFVILPLGWLALFVFMIIGLIGAAQGKMNDLPLLGKIKIIK